MKMLLHTIVVAGLLTIATYQANANDAATTLSPRPTYQLRVCRGIADVVLVLDRSGSVGDEDYPFLVGFANHLARTFQISPDKVRLGVASYADTAKREIDINTCCVDEFKRITGTMSRGTEELTNIYSGLLKAEEMLQDKSTGARDEAVKLIVITNDDHANRGLRPIPTAKRLAKKGINIVSIGIESDVAEPNNEEVKNLASRKDLYYHVPEYTGLADEGFLKKVSDSVCDIVTVVEPVVGDTSETIYEDTPIDTVIHKIPILVEEFNRPQYTLIPQDGLPFSVSVDGVITVTGGLDYEVVQKYEFFVHVTDTNFPGFKKKIKVTIFILDRNDNHPTFDELEYVVKVYEDVQYNPPKTIFTLEASDADSGKNAELRYILNPAGNEDAKFQVVAETGELQVKGKLDRESVDQYELTAYAKDLGTPSKRSTNIKIKVIVLDVNDNAPQPKDAEIYLTYPETQELGKLYTLEASDLDLGINKEFFFKFASSNDGNEDGNFDLNQNTGVIRLIKSFNFEERSKYKLNFIVQDKGEPSLSSKITVHVTITNFDEPITIEGPYDVKIPEDYGKKDVVVTVVANDPDNEKITWKILEDSPFVIDESGNIRVGGLIDREGDKWIYELTVQASAGKHTVTTTVKITVTDVNDNDPIFKAKSHFGSIKENSKVNTPIIIDNEIKATDADATAPNNQFMFSIDNGNINDAFKIHPTTGVISVNKPGELDFESATTVYELTLKVTDKGKPSRHSYSKLFIRIVNANDNKPEPTVPSYDEEIYENHGLNNVVKVEATDADKNALAYTITDDLPFSIDRQSGQIKVSGELDAEKQTVYSFKVTVTDGLNEIEIPVKITIKDVNDVVPIIKPEGDLIYSVSEDRESGYTIVKLSGYDGDLTAPNNEFMLAISQGNDDGLFKLEGDGTLKLNGKLDFNKKKQHMFYVQITDKGVNPGSLSSERKVTINVKDVNIHAPQFTGTPYSAEIPENQPNLFVFKVTATDADLPNDVLTYSIVNDVPFVIDPESGVIKGNQIFDSEGVYTYQIKVKVTDKAGHSDETTLDVLILDENDNTPYFVSGEKVLMVKEDTDLTTVVETYQAKDNDRTKPNNEVMYRIISNDGNHFVINEATGELTLIKALDFEKKREHKITIQARDKGTPPLFTNLEVTIKVQNVNEYAPVFTKKSYEESVSEAEKDGFEVLTVEATDDDADSVISYSLPSTLPFAIDNEGVITLKSLNPPELPLDFEKQQSYEFDVTATDNGGKSSTASVTIYVLDVNDNSPVFKENKYVEYVKEDVDVPSFVVKVEAEDLDGGKNGEIMYSIIEGNVKNTFEIESATGKINVVKSLDFETLNIYTLTVQATDKGSPSKSDTTSVVVNVLDVNEAPYFDPKSDDVDVSENAAVGDEIKKVSATDVDAGDNGKVMYSIVSGNEDGKFDLNTNSGQVSLAATVDFETKSKYVLIIRASDKGKPSLTTEKHDFQLTINILDENEKPYFVVKTAAKTIPEDKAKNSKVITVVAEDDDAGKAGEIMYSIISGNTNDDFKIGENSGVITVANKLDFNRQQKYVLTVRATDKGTPSMNSSPNDMVVTITVTDVNDNRPIFKPEVYTQTIPETSEINDKVIQVFATDKDSGLNGMIRYEIIGGNDDDTFAINENDGQITLNKKVDYEKQAEYILTVRAFDKGDPIRHSNPDAQVTVKISNINEHPPQILNLPKVIEIKEESKAAVIYTVEATDKDGDDITFSIKNPQEGFEINAETGEVSTTKPLDREDTAGYRLIIVASDGKLTDESTLDINLMDINDNKPKFVDLVYKEKISENSPTEREVVKVEAKDLDVGQNKEIMFMIVSGNEEGKFKIEKDSGWIKVAAKLDYETTQAYELEVKAVDKGDPQQTSMVNAKVIIEIIDENDNHPIFKPAGPVYIPEDRDTPSKVITVEATDADSGNDGMVVYSIVKGNEDGKFKIDAGTGEVTLIGELDYETVKKYILTIRATDKGNPPKTSEPDDLELTIHVTDVNDNTPQFTQKEYTETIPEDTKPGKLILTVEATDEDDNKNGEFMFSLKDGHDGKFKVDENNGKITLVSGLDVTIQKLYIFTVLATDKGDPSRTGEALVRIHVTDVNNHKPVFDPIKYTKSFVENVDIDTVVTTVKATDKDEGKNGEIMYEIIEGNDEKKFKINMKTGEIKFIDTVDFEKNKQYVLTVRATDKGDEPLHSNPDAMVTIDITDYNDNPPVFDPKSYAKTIPENTPKDEFILQVITTDADSGVNAQVMYEIVTDDFGKFRIDMDTGKIFTTDTFDVTVKDKFEFTVKATDKGTPSKSATSKVTIFISDVNMAPKIYPGGPFTILDNKPVDEKVFEVKAEDMDIGDNGKIMYELVNDGEGRFKIDMDTGVVTVAKNLALKTQIEVTIKVKVSDKGDPSLSSEEEFKIIIKPSNHAPVISPVDPVSIREDTPKKTNVVKVEAFDKDEGDNGKIMFEIISGNDGDAFAIDMGTGQITVNKELDYDKQNVYNLVVRVTDKGDPALSVETTVKILITENTTPSFSNAPFDVCIDENLESGIPVFKAEAEDSDGDVLIFFIPEEFKSLPFAIDEKNGVVTTTKVLDAETETNYKFAIGVSDGKHEITVEVKVCVNDVNDVPPIVETPASVEVCEDKGEGDFVLQIKAEDGDVTKKSLTYKIPNADEIPFAIDNTGKITLDGEIDYEDTTSYKFNVVVSDGESKTTVEVTVTICNVNDNKPKLTVPAKECIDENEDSGSIVFTAKATDDDGDKLKFFIPDEFKSYPFSIDADTGVLTTTEKLDAEMKQEYTIKVGVSDGVKQDIKEVVICVNDVNDVPPIVETPASVEVCEDKGEGDFVLQIKAEDGDVTKKSLTYKIPNADEIPFAIDNSGKITLDGEIDYEDTTSYKFNVVVSDGESKTTVEVTVTICNVNDHQPKLTVPAKECIDENKDSGSIVFTAEATDADGDKLMFFIPDEFKSYPFSIDADTGVLTTTEKLDAEIKQEYTIKVGVSDGVKQDIKEVVICVNDVNDVPPIVETPASVEVCEDKGEGDFVLQIKAEDGDVTKKSLTYKIPNADEIPFAIDNTGKITLDGEIDYEDTTSYKFNVVVSDGESKTTVEVTVTICNVNDHQPKLTVPAKECIDENKDSGSIVFTAEATDADGDKLMFFIPDEFKSYPFSIDADTGVLTTTEKLDAEIKQEYTIKVGVSDGVKQDIKEVVICVNDVNDVPPIVETPASVEVCEDKGEGDFVLQIKAEDGDVTKKSLTYKIPNADEIPFAIDNTGKITLDGEIDYEDIMSYKFNVFVSDGESDTTVEVTVTICNVMDNKPKLAVPEKKCIKENEDSGTIVFKAEATDLDGDKLMFFIPDEFKSYPFSIDADTGVLTTTEKLDAEVKQEYTIKVGVSDGLEQDIKEVVICVIDVNEFAPSVEIPNEVEICENADKGTAVLNIIAQDNDISEDQLTYKLLVKDAVPFLIDSDGKITVNGPLDFETTPSYQFIVRVSDEDNLFTDVEVRIKICDLNEYKPVFDPETYESKIPDGSEQGKFIVKVTATDKDTGINGMIVYKIIDGNDDDTFTIDGNTGEITLNKKVDASVKNMYLLTVSATDKGKNPGPMTSSPNAMVKVIIMEKKELCECKLEEESYPCLKWTKFEIIRNFEGKCYLDKLKAAIEQIKAKIAANAKLTTDFTQCKSDLKNEISSKSGAFTYADLFMRYDQCLVNIDCKLSLWKIQLEQKLAQLEKERMIEEEGWGTFNIPGSDYMDAMMRFMKRSQSSRSD